MIGRLFSRKSNALPHILFLICFVCITSGFLSPEQISTHNRKSLAKLEIGMKKDTVKTLMGMTDAKDFDDRGSYVINNPYKTEVLYSKKATFEVLYYLTERMQTERQLALEELTPLVFKGNNLVGWGWKFLRQVTIENKIALDLQQ